MTYVISDIHGEYELFMKLLEKIDYKEGDLLYVCGDFIDKGAQSVKLAKQLFSMPGAYCIRGNHEELFFRYYRAHMHSAIMDFDDILWHLQRYFPEDGHLLDWDTVDRLADLPYYLETDRFFCVHAGLSLDEQGNAMHPDFSEPEELIYTRRFKEPEVLPDLGKCVMFGHTPTSYLCNEPTILTYGYGGLVQDATDVGALSKVHLDTGVGQSGVLGCFRVEDCKTFYVSR